MQGTGPLISCVLWCALCLAVAMGCETQKRGWDDPGERESGAYENSEFFPIRNFVGPLKQFDYDFQKLRSHKRELISINLVASNRISNFRTGNRAGFGKNFLHSSLENHSTPERANCFNTFAAAK